MRTELKNLHGRFLRNLSPMLECPLSPSQSTRWLGRSVSSIPSVMLPNLSTPARVMTVTEYHIRGGGFPASTANLLYLLFVSPTCYCCMIACISMPASARSPVWHSAVQAHGILSPLSVSRKRGRGLVRTIFILTQVLVHSQSRLQVRGIKL